GLLLARLSEIRPVAGYGRIEIQLSAIGGHVRAQRHRTLGRREDYRDSFAGPGCTVDRDATAPQVGDCPALERDATAGPNLVVLLEVLDEGIDHALEPGIEFTLDRTRARILRNRSIRHRSYSPVRFTPTLCQSRPSGSLFVLIPLDRTAQPTFLLHRANLLIARAEMEDRIELGAGQHGGAEPPDIHRPVDRKLLQPEFLRGNLGYPSCVIVGLLLEGLGGEGTGGEPVRLCFLAADPAAGKECQVLG